MGFKILMLKAGLTQAKLAQRLNTYQQKVGRWVNGSQPDFADLPKLAEVLGVSIEDVVMAFLDK